MNLQSFNIQLIHIYRKVEGATPKRWQKVRGYDKPIYFPGGIHGLGKSDGTSSREEIGWDFQEKLRLVGQSVKKWYQMIEFSIETNWYTPEV